jgi:hypothetical protein
VLRQPSPRGIAADPDTVGRTLRPLPRDVFHEPCIGEIVLNLIVTTYFDATLAGVAWLFAMLALDELRSI